MTPFWCFYCLIWTYATPFSSVSCVDFEQVNVSRDLINPLMHIVEKWSNILKILAVFKPQDFQSMFEQFSTLSVKGLTHFVPRSPLFQSLLPEHTERKETFVPYWLMATRKTQKQQQPRLVSNGLMVKTLDSWSRDSWFENTGWLQGLQPFNLPRFVNWVPGIPGDLVVKVFFFLSFKFHWNRLKYISLTSPTILLANINSKSPINIVLVSLLLTLSRYLPNHDLSMFIYCHV